MLDATQLLTIFKEFSLELQSTNRMESFFIMGGSAFLALQLNDQITLDTDLAFPKLDPGLKIISKKLSAKFELPNDWLNNGGQSFANQLPEGWKFRALNFFNSKHLEVKCLSLKDLLFLKCLAYFDREKTRDLDDIKSLKPNTKDLNDTFKWMATILEDQESIKSLKLYFKHLRNLLNEK